MVMGISIFIDAPSLVDCRPRLKSNSLVHEMKTIPRQKSNCNWKIFIGKAFLETCWSPVPMFSCEISEFFRTSISNLLPLYCLYYWLIYLHKLYYKLLTKVTIQSNCIKTCFVRNKILVQKFVYILILFQN